MKGKQRGFCSLKTAGSLATALIMMVFVVSCTAPSSDLMAPPKEIRVASLSGGQLQLSFRPKVGVVFLFDDSRTMTRHESRFGPELRRIFAELPANNLIDLKVAFASVWDGRRYQTNSNPQGVVPEIGSDGLRNFYPLGEFVPLREPVEGQWLLPAEKNGSKRFVSRSEGSAEVLQTTLKEGLWTKCHEFYHPDLSASRFRLAEAEANVDLPAGSAPWQCLLPKDPKEGRGPQYEEIFTPLRAVLLNCKIPGHPNFGFCDEDRFLVVVIVTDAEDGSPNISAEEMAQFLREHTGQLGTSVNDQRFAIFGITYPAAKPDKRGSCQRDFAGPATKLERFFDLVGATTFDICESDYSAMVDKIVNEVQSKALGRLVSLDPYEAEYFDPIEAKDRERPKPLPLCSGEIPETSEGLHWIRVCYGAEEVPAEFWQYNEAANAVRVSPTWRPKTEEGAWFRLLFTPIYYGLL